MATYTCTGCGYVYDETAGLPREGYPPGTTWDELPEDFPCPACAVCEKPEFEPTEDN